VNKFFSWFAKWLGLTPLEFWFPQKANPFIEEHVRAMRNAWTLAASELNLVYSKGKVLYQDKITGMLDGFRIAIFNESNFDIKRLVTAIRVFSEGILPASESEDLDCAELLAAYDDSVRAIGSVPKGTLSDEARNWFLGYHNGGPGTEVEDGNLIFRGAFAIDDAEALVLVARAMVLAILQLASAKEK
jgi:hypothetical protein